MKTKHISTRQHILETASRLFYAQGIRAVSVDAIAEKACITKKTIYYHFKSKDELVAGYLDARDQPNLALFAQWFAESQGDVAQKTASIFLRLAENAQHPKWKGCGFLRTAAELANMPGHPAVVIGAAHKKKFEKWLSETYAKAGLKNANFLARSVALLMEGSFSAMLIHRDPTYATAAAQTASMLLSHAEKD